MINLIPSNAKKSITLEYWIRVCTAWFFLWSTALLFGVVALIPAFLLINIQVSVFESSAKIAQESVESYAQVTKSLETSTSQAKLIVDARSVPVINDYISLFESLQGPSIELTKITINRSDKGIEPVSLAGTAFDRESLAAFRDRLLADPAVTAVDLPISNLAKDKDIQFTLTVTIDNKVSL